jgi:hypothetical protein
MKRIALTAFSIVIVVLAGFAGATKNPDNTKYEGFKISCNSSNCQSSK